MDNMELVPLELIISDRDGIRKVREAFLISKGKFLEPFGLNRRSEIWSIYFLEYFSLYRRFGKRYNFSLFLSTNHVTYISCSIVLSFVTVLSIVT